VNPPIPIETEPEAGMDASAPSASKSFDSGGRIWIAWERQRRSLNLSRRLGARLVLCIDERPGWLRYPHSIARTAALLRTWRGGTVMVQNPSMVLATLACLLKDVFGYALVVDRHSNFGFLAGQGAGLKRRLSDLLSDYTLRRADLTIVTNGELRDRVERAGGRGFVLPDPFPDLSAFRESAEAGPDFLSKPRHRPLRIFFVSSWAFDEPIAEAIEACRRLAGEVEVRITGRPKPAYRTMLERAPDNFIPTGFLDDEEYFRLMARSDAVMAVTSREATLVCGGYEGLALGKPLILGNSPALREYFRLGCVYTDGSVPDLEARMREMAGRLPDFRAGARRLYSERGDEWEERLANLESILMALRPG